MPKSDTQFKPGQSGNPGGKPKMIKKVINLARKQTVHAMTQLAAIAGDSMLDPRARVAAAQTLLDRGWGKAPQSIELGGKDGAPIHVTLQEFLTGPVDGK